MVTVETAETGSNLTPGNSRKSIPKAIHALATYVAVFTSGAACLAIEVIAPRVLARLYGNTHVVWTACIVITLTGMSVGYVLGGVSAGRGAARVLSLALGVAAVAVPVLEAAIYYASGIIGTLSDASVFITAGVALGVPAVAFGCVSPAAVARIAELRGAAETTAIGVVLAVGTIGSIVGAVCATMYGIPVLGISASLWTIAGLLLVVACVCGLGWRRAIAAVVIVIAGGGLPAEGVPNPDRIAHCETIYQSVSIWQSPDGKARAMTFGPACESIYNHETRCSEAPYARALGNVIRSRAIKSVLMIGGAGNALGLELEHGGIDVTLVEIDPEVVALGERYFGSSRGRVVIGDGRRVLQSEIGVFDAVVLDAFASPGVVPFNLVSVEGLQQARRCTADNGIVVMNVLGYLTGPHSEVISVIVRTAQEVFPHVAVWPSRVSQHNATYQNILVVCGDTQSVVGVPCDVAGAQVATDNRNPLERMMAAAYACATGGRELAREQGPWTRGTR